MDQLSCCLSRWCAQNSLSSANYSYMLLAAVTYETDLTHALDEDDQSVLGHGKPSLTRTLSHVVATPLRG